MKQDVKFGAEAREGIAKGVNIVADAVGVTLGGKGRNVIIDTREGLDPIITKDGVSVASAIHLVDPLERIGQELIQAVARKTREDAGDGTTTSSVLAQYILNEGLLSINNGKNSTDLKKGIDLAVVDVVGQLKGMSKDISNDYDSLLAIATVSANGSEEIGKLVADVVYKVKLDGIVIVNESDLGKTFVDTIDGAKINAGYESPAFITDPSGMKSVIMDANIVLCNQHMATTKDILPVLEAYQSLGNKKPIVWVVSKMDGEALSTIVSNNNDFLNSGGSKGLSSLVIEVPGGSQMKTDTLNDLAALVGGVVISHNQGVSVNSFKEDMFGYSGRVVADDVKTMILDCKSVLIADRVSLLRDQIKSSDDDVMKKMALEGRLARLTGGVAIIRVGGKTQMEMKERFDLIEDAVGSTRSALAEGIIPGGGVSFLSIDIKVKSDNDSIQEGINILGEALIEPFNIIMENAGEESGDIFETLLSDKSNSYGYNVKTEGYCDMIDEGIIDPTKVARVSLENAASIAGLFLTTEVVISNIEK